jgi:hypothetical protein
MGKKTGASAWSFDVPGAQGYKYIRLVTGDGSITLAQAYNEAGMPDVGDTPIDVDIYADGRIIITKERYNGSADTYAKPTIADYERSSTQSIPDATNTRVDFADLIIDNYSTVTTGASWVFTVQVPGYYGVYAHIQYAVVTTTPRIDILHNGTVVARELPGGTGTSFQVYRVLELAVGDTVYFETRHSTGSAQNLSGNANRNWCSIKEIR